jgi:hypothetical protein
LNRGDWGAVNALLNSLDEAELGLIRETERSRIDALDEDALGELHARVRRARNKYAKLYRRQASARVPESGGRGLARPQNRRNAGKAEVFEDALARVSRRLAVVARHSAAELKAERLAAATRDGAGPTRATPARRRPPRSSPGMPASTRVDDKSPVRKKREAATLAAGARRQTKRDSR